MSAQPPQSEPKTERTTFWQRRVIDPIAHQLTQGITPEKIALTLAIGTACGLFPIPGTTTILCLIAGIVFSLNQPIIQIVNGVCAPVHLPVIIALFRFGSFIFGVHRPRLGIRSIGQMLWDQPRLFFDRYGPDVLHATVAWAIIAPFWIAGIYFLALPVLREIVRIKVVPLPEEPKPPETPPV